MFNDKDERKIMLSEKNEIGFKHDLYDKLLGKNERVLMEFMSQRNVLVFTDEKIIAIRIEAYTAKHKAGLCIPYSSISAYSAEVSLNKDMDTEIKVWIPGMDCVTFTFLEDTAPMRDIVAILVEKVK